MLTVLQHVKNKELAILPCNSGTCQYTAPDGMDFSEYRIVTENLYGFKSGILCDFLVVSFFSSLFKGKESEFS